MDNNQIEVTRMSHFVGIGLVLGFLLPHTSTAFLLVNPLLCLFYQCFKQNRDFYKWNWLVLVPLTVTTLINLPQDISQKAMMSSMAILLYFLCFPMVGKVKIPNTYFYVILGVIFLSQIAYTYNITFMEHFLETYYPISEEDRAQQHYQDVINADNMYNFRLGGLFHNANQCARYLTFLLTAFMVLNSDKSIRKQFPFIVVAYYAVLLTGSRTGFVIASALIFVYLFVEKKVSVGWRYLFLFFAIGLFVYLPFYEADTLRGLDISRTGSMEKKFYTFVYYLTTEDSFVRLLLGYLDTSRYDISEALSSRVMASFDTDYGSIIFSYGFIGFFCILFYYFTIFKRMNRYGRVYSILLFWMLSSTIVKSFRALFLFMLLSSIIYGNCKRPTEASHRHGFC